MKWIVIILAVIIVILGAFLLFYEKAEAPSTDEASVTISP